MKQIDAYLPATDGVACFNRMYLEVTENVNSHITAGFFADPDFLSSLDVTFANIYFAAVDAMTGPADVFPEAWKPLLNGRSKKGVFPIQFALAGMNAHINHDLPVALVETCAELGTAPDAGTHHDDYQKVDVLLDAAEQSVRESFESGVVLSVDRRARMVLDLVDNWSMNSARRRRLGEQPRALAMPRERCGRERHGGRPGPDRGHGEQFSAGVARQRDRSGDRHRDPGCGCRPGLLRPDLALGRGHAPWVIPPAGARRSPAASREHP